MYIDYKSYGNKKKNIDENMHVIHVQYLTFRKCFILKSTNTIEVMLLVIAFI